MWLVVVDVTACISLWNLPLLYMEYKSVMALFTLYLSYVNVSFSIVSTVTIMCNTCCKYATSNIVLNKYSSRIADITSFNSLVHFVFAQNLAY